MASAGSQMALAFTGLTVHKSVSSILLHEAGARTGYSAPLAVLLGELCKLVMCFVLLCLHVRKQRRGWIQSQAPPAAWMAPRPADGSRSPIGFEDKEPDADGLFVSQHMPTHPTIRPSLCQEALALIFQKRAWAMLAPAAIYVLQNNLFLFSAAHIHPSVFQVCEECSPTPPQPLIRSTQALWQLRILFTAALSQTMLKKRIVAKQWAMLMVLVVGVLLIQAAVPGGPSGGVQAADEAAAMDSTAARVRSIVEGAVDGVATLKQAKALLASLALASLGLAMALSALAGVMLERAFKDGDTVLWAANVQLCLFSLVPAAVLVAGQLVGTGGEAGTPDARTMFSVFAHSTWPWIAVLIHGTAGVLVALVTKTAGVIATNFSNAVAIVATYIIMIPLAAALPTLQSTGLLLAGSTLILGSSFQYRCYSVDADGRAQSNDLLEEDDGSSSLGEDGASLLLSPRSSDSDKHITTEPRR